MDKKERNKKKMNKPTIFFLCLFIGFASGTVLGLGLNQIVVNDSPKSK